MSKSLRRVEAALRDAGIAPAIRRMPSETCTAALAATAIGCETDQIAKLIVFRGRRNGKAVLFVMAGAQLVDFDQASTLAEKELDRADGVLIRAQTGFAIGGVAPDHHLIQPHTWFDHALFAFPVVWAAAGSWHRHQVVPINPETRAKISGTDSADFFDWIGPSNPSLFWFCSNAFEGSNNARWTLEPAETMMSDLVERIEMLERSK